MLRFVICGLEHSGTTLVSDLFRQVPGLDAGFEVGVLLGRRPRDLPDFDPYYEQMLRGWGLSREALAQCCATDDFAEFYRRLAAAAPLRPGTIGIFDKTPRYIAILADCLARVPVPFIVTAKDPRATVHSDFRHSGAADFDAWYDGYREEKQGYMQLAYAQWQQAGGRRARRRVFRLRLEELCLAARRSGEALFAHVGLPFRPEYTAFGELKFGRTQGRSISVGAPFDYVRALSPAQRRRIEQDFAAFADWFYS